MIEKTILLVVLAAAGGSGKGAEAPPRLFAGKVQVIPAPGSKAVSFTMNGGASKKFREVRVQTSPKTRWITEGKATRDLRLGTPVLVRASAQPDGSWMAVEIKVQDPDLKPGASMAPSGGLGRP